MITRCAGPGGWLLGDSAGGHADGHEVGAWLVPGGPLGGAVGDESGDGPVGFATGLAAAGVSLERAPPAYFGVGVLDADPAGGLAAFVLASAVILGERPVGRVRHALRLPRRGRDLAGKLVRQAPVSVVGLGFHAGVLVELCCDALGAHGGLVVQRPGRSAPDQRSPAGAGLIGQPFAVIASAQRPPQRGLRIQRRPVTLVEPQPDERLRAGGQPLLGLGALAFDTYQLVTPVDIDAADSEQLRRCLPKPVPAPLPAPQPKARTSTRPEAAWFQSVNVLTCDFCERY